MQALKRKQLGAYFTPDAAAATLVKWAARSPHDRLLDPSAGDGQFLAQHRRSVGVETDAASAAVARSRAPWALIHEGDFFAWAERTKERFECAAGNPPFIRYQRFSGEVREGALRLCQKLGADFSGLASSWAPFLVAAASLLKPGGRLAFVVPAEIGHAPYAAPLIRYLLSSFADIRILAIREKVFADLSEDVWFLYAEGHGTPAKGFLLSTVERFAHADEPPSAGRFISEADLERWNFRLRPFLIPAKALEMYTARTSNPRTARLGDLAKVGIGYVTGANDFFHLRPSVARKLGISKRFLKVSVRNGRALPERAITQTTIATWLSNDEACLLLNLPPVADLPNPIRRYLDSDDGQEARCAYKCRVRDPWYSVPDVTVPDGFLSYMSGTSPALVANPAKCVGTNSVHTVRLTSRVKLTQLQAAWGSALTALSCEVEGHPLGGGLLKLEPREAQRVVVPLTRSAEGTGDRALMEGVHVLRSWRHCNG